MTNSPPDPADGPRGHPDTMPAGPNNRETGQTMIIVGVIIIALGLLLAIASPFVWLGTVIDPNPEPPLDSPEYEARFFRTDELHAVDLEAGQRKVIVTRSDLSVPKSCKVNGPAGEPVGLEDSPREASSDAENVGVFEATTDGTYKMTCTSLDEFDRFMVRASAEDKYQSDESGLGFYIPLGIAAIAIPIGLIIMIIGLVRRSRWKE